MPTPDSMKDLTSLYEQIASLAHELKTYGQSDLRLYTLANHMGTLALFVKQLQLEVTNLDQRLDELGRKVSQHADELSRLRNGSWA